MGGRGGLLNFSRKPIAGAEFVIGEPRTDARR
jgi:hypothetical protein